MYKTSSLRTRHQENHILPIKIALVEKELIEKITSFKKSQMTSLCIEKRTNFE